MADLRPAPFIVGVGRSGTTLLRLMLDAHPDLAIPTETVFLAGLAELDAKDLTVEMVLRTILAAPTWPNLATEEADLRTALAGLDPATGADAIRAFYSLYAARRGKRRWGDKTPPYRGYIKPIGKLLPEARFLHIIRDGRDVALSYRGLWFGPGDDIEAQARFWVEQVRGAQAQAASVLHYLEVRYETLVKQPEKSLASICGYLDLPFDAAMLEYHQTASARLAEFTQPFGPGSTPQDIQRFVAIHDHTKRLPDPARIARWKSEMSRSDRQLYEAIAGPLLAQLGYET